MPNHVKTLFFSLGWVLATQVPLSSQEIALADIPGFFSFEAEALQRLSFEGSGAAAHNVGHHTDGKLFWWMPADASGVFFAQPLGGELQLFKIDPKSASVTQLGTVPGKGYGDMRGHGATIYLLRIDTADNRHRLITDVYSIAERRIVATRTLLDRPLHPYKFLGKVVWDERLQAIAVSLNDRPGGAATTREMHVINLQTGFEFLPTARDPSEGLPPLERLVPMRFDASGHRLFLAHRGRSETAQDSRIYQFDLEAKTLTPIGSDSLPSRGPVCINHDASLAVFANSQGYEVWRVDQSMAIGSFRRGPSAFSGLGKPIMQFVGGGEVLAVSEGESLRLFSGFSKTPDQEQLSVIEHQVRPKDAASPSADYVPIFLSGHADQIFHFGTFTTYIPDRGSNAPWMQRVKIHFPGAGEETPVTPLKRGQHVKLPSDEWTPWAPGPRYQQQFNKITEQGKYPVSVYGRLRNGRMEFRGRFFDRPADLTFATHHGIDEETLYRKDLQYGRRLREVWRHSFIDANGTLRYSVIWWEAVDRNPKSSRQSSRKNPG